MVVLKTKTNLFNNSLQPLTINLIASSVTNGTGSATFDNPIPEDEFEPVPDPTDPTPDPGDPTINVTTICIDCVDPSPENPPIGPILVDESGSYYPPIDLPETGSVVINGKYRWVFEGEFEPTVDFDESKLYTVIIEGVLRPSTTAVKMSIPLDSEQNLTGSESDWYHNGTREQESLRFLPGWPLAQGSTSPGASTFDSPDIFHSVDNFTTSYTGDVFAIGKPYYDFHRGGVWVWEYNFISDQWIERKLPDPPGLEDMQDFGSAIAINQTGDTIAVASSRIFVGFFGLVNTGSGQYISTTVLNGEFGYDYEVKSMVLLRLRDKIYWDKALGPDTRWIVVPGSDYATSPGQLGGYATTYPQNSKDFWNPISGSWEQNILQMFPGVPNGEINDLKSEYAVKKQKISIYKKTYNSGFDNPVWTHVQEIELDGTLEQIAKLEEHALDFDWEGDNPPAPLYFSLDNTLYAKRRKTSPLPYEAATPEAWVHLLPDAPAEAISSVVLKFDYSLQNQQYDSPTQISYEELDQIIEGERYNLGLEDLSEEISCYYIDNNFGNPLSPYSNYVNKFREKEKIVIENPAQRLQYSLRHFGKVIKISSLSNLIVSDISDYFTRYPMYYGQGDISNYSCYAKVISEEWLSTNNIECDTLSSPANGGPSPISVDSDDDWQCDPLPAVGGADPNDQDFSLLTVYDLIGLPGRHHEVFSKRKLRVYKKKLFV